MKYIDADKLIAEIERKRDSALERQKNLEKIGQDTVLNEMIAFELNRLISFIDSLQQEQPDKYNRALEKGRGWMPNMNQGGQAILIDIFPELGENLDPRYGLPEQPASEGLEEEIKRFLSNATKMNKGEWRGKYSISEIGFRAVAHHFYELGRNARKEDKL